MLTDDMGKITKKYETNSGHILSAALTVVSIMIDLQQWKTYVGLQPPLKESY